ncbi:hypothetical protein HRbin07_00728 [bacterium HR07]|nr:hypothetical protein HRbin07_00728 [bacterium HR07]
MYGPGKAWLCQHPRVLAVEIFPGLILIRFGGDDHDPMMNALLALRAAQYRREVPNKPGDLANRCVCMHADLGVGLDLTNELRAQGLDVGAFGRTSDLFQLISQLGTTLHKMRLEAALRKRQRRDHPR